MCRSATSRYNSTALLKVFQLQMNTFDLKTQEQRVIVVDDPSKLLLGFLRCFVQKTVGYCKRLSVIVLVLPVVIHRKNLGY